jgi:hypothetical protein
MLPFYSTTCRESFGATVRNVPFMKHQGFLSICVPTGCYLDWRWINYALSQGIPVRVMDNQEKALLSQLNGTET